MYKQWNWLTNQDFRDLIGYLVVYLRKLYEHLSALSNTSRLA